jgi:uracil-DNA glycosylase family 4
MDRREAILRELNLHPLWKRRDAPAPAPLAAEPGAAEPDAVIQQEAPVPATVAGSMHKANFSTLAVQQHAKAETIPAPAVTPHSDVAGLDWSALKQRVSACSACKLRAGCTQTVFGVGDEHADWLFVGEGPGADEDALGEPFVGQAGKLLDNMLIAIKLKRGKNVYIANVVKCRPPGNRNPDAEEIAACLPYLQRQIELIKPKLIVALGKVASNALLGRDATLASLRGKLHEYHVASATGMEEGQVDESSHQSSSPHQTTSSHRIRTTIPLIVTYHPAYLLRSPTEKAKAWQDLTMAVRAGRGEA